jgi:tetratricopeptide (TPR) repeat protein
MAEKKWTFRFRTRTLAEGEPMTLGQAEDYLPAKLSDPEQDPQAVRLELVRFYGSIDREAEAMRYADEYLGDCDDPSEGARMFFHQGQLTEHMKDWETALWFYRRALESASSLDAPYFFYNNIGFCLIQLNRPAEAEPHLREAIRIDPSRANAFKNLGLSLQGQGRFGEAARVFIRAVRTDASDPRAFRHLEELAQRHKEIHAEIPDLEAEISRCRDAVAFARARQPADPNRVQ